MRTDVDSIVRNQRGFSLLEMLLSVLIIGLLAGLSLPLYQSFQSRNDLDITAQSVADAIRRAQLYARSGNGDSAWSVRIQSGTALLYKGTNFAGRTTSFDETVSIPSSFSVAGLSDVSFGKLDGTVTGAGSITLTASANDVRTITVNAEGMVSY